VANKLHDEISRRRTPEAVRVADGFCENDGETQTDNARDPCVTRQFLGPTQYETHTIVVSGAVQELQWYASRERNASRIMVEVSGGRTADEAESGLSRHPRRKVTLAQIPTGRATGGCSDRQVPL
jgi:hypothetical protein